MASDDPAAAAAAVGHLIEKAFRVVLVPFVARIQALETATAEIGTLRARIAALEARSADPSDQVLARG